MKMADVPVFIKQYFLEELQFQVWLKSVEFWLIVTKYDPRSAKVLIYAETFLL